MKICNCGARLADNAEKCPFCGHVSTSRAAMLGLLGIGIVFMLCILLLLLGSNG